jgi:drug/metabolite transporter (DMT)-like permease
MNLFIDSMRLQRFLFISSKAHQSRSVLMSSNLKNYIILVFGTLFWGASWVSAKILVSGVEAPPMTIGFFRFLSASICFIIVMPIIGIKPYQAFKRSNLKLIFLLGLTGVFGYGVFFLIGMRFTTATQGSIIAGVNPASVSLFAYIIHGERLDRAWKYAGFLISFTGIIFVIGIQALLNFQLEYLIGNLLIFCAMMIWGLYSSIGKKAMENMSAVETTATGVMIGAILFGIGAAFESFWIHPAMVNPSFWIQALFLGIFVTFIGFFFYFYGIEKLGATRTAIFINLVPVFGTILSVLILEEQIYWTFLVGLALVITGITIINLPIEKPA